MTRWVDGVWWLRNEDTSYDDDDEIWDGQANKHTNFADDWTGLIRGGSRDETTCQLD